MKLDSTRVNETINFIDNYANASMLRRQAVARFCRQTYPKLSPFDFGAYHTEFHEMASAMSVKRHATTVPTGNQIERAKRRAILLIWKSLGRAVNNPGATDARANAAMTMTTGNLDAALNVAIVKASVFASLASAADIFNNELVAHTGRFLTAHKVIVKGSTAGGAKFTALGGFDYTNVLNFNFYYDVGGDRFVFDPAMPLQGACHSFSTVSVPAVNWYDVPGNGGEVNPNTGAANFAQILGCQLTGANFMLTTQFTGCTFCWTNHAGMIRASHIGPTKAGFIKPELATSYPGGGNALAQRMMTQATPIPIGVGVPARMANAPGAALNVFGRGAGNAPAIGGGNSFYPNGNLGQATIIGHNQRGAWRFYLQALDLPKTTITEARRIM